MSKFELPSLGYGYDALNPKIDTETMTIHHTRHHQAYINNLNAVVEANSQLQGMSLADISRNIATLPEDIQTAVRNNGGGHWNHTEFWQWMAPIGTVNHEPFGPVKEAIESAFGSFDQMKEQFNKAAASRFGSGWAWLCMAEDGKLFISSTPNQDNPLMKGVVQQYGQPLLGLDVWEHAYYLKYQNKRPEYIQAFWSVANFDRVNELFVNARK